MSTWISAKQFGTYSLKDNKLKTWRRPKDASQKIAWRKKPNKNQRKAISRAQARMLNRP